MENEKTTKQGLFARKTDDSELRQVKSSISILNKNQQGLNDSLEMLDSKLDQEIKSIRKAMQTGSNYKDMPLLARVTNDDACLLVKVPKQELLVREEDIQEVFQLFRHLGVRHEGTEIEKPEEIKEIVETEIVDLENVEKPIGQDEN